MVDQGHQDLEQKRAVEKGLLGGVMMKVEQYDDDLDLADFIEDEEEVQCLYDDIPPKEFEDYLDGTQAMDKTYKNGKVWRDCEFGSIKLEPWLIFANKESFYEVFKDFCVQEDFGVFVEKSDPTRHLQSDIQANPDIPVESLQRICMERYIIQVKKRLFYKVKAIAKELIHGGFGEAYSLLPRYAEMVKQTNPGSYALVTWTQVCANVQPRYKACFFSFAAQVRGFLRGCRPIIGIDGAHLSGYYKGILLTAVGIDGNNEIFVFAYGIVCTESVETWDYFMRNLKCLFEKEGCNRDDWTFLSDRMKGVDATIMEAFPRASRRICCQHLYSNCKTKGFSGTTFHKLFWVAADAYNPYVFNKAMEKIHAYNPDVVLYLESTTEVWSRHQFDPVVCCDHNTTNFVESFNSCTKP
ncbi:uncharacterized protein LOC110694608 [Chenopodium quinoa]|uniref:uncharacterized protein LOC110694608 n=1 Tax=Chenopodium quinoa TaxID=63459 RepID=UPI000B7952AD|nr:uncharacterized protein LOC110694608 [Chenopodium quinoa]